jgi:hypothetical protein
VKRLIVLAAILLPGCGFLPTVEVAGDPPPWPDMPANVRMGCDGIDNTLRRDMATLYDGHNELIGQYVECAKRGQAKVDWYERTRPKVKK